MTIPSLTQTTHYTIKEFQLLVKEGATEAAVPKAAANFSRLHVIFIALNSLELAVFF